MIIVYSWEVIIDRSILFGSLLFSEDPFDGKPNVPRRS